MTPERSLKVHQLFAEALRLPAVERGAFVRQSCGSDRELLEDVESLLAEVTQTMTSIEGLRQRERPGEKAPVRVRLKGRYQLQHVIGQGGFGTAYLATDEELLSKRVVIKVLHNAPAGSWERRKFRDEVYALAHLNHPGIVSILDSGETEDGRPFLVMEYVEGESLRSSIPSQGMNLEMVAEIARQAGVALEAAHQSGIWHRDLKPENILIQSLADGDLRVKGPTSHLGWLTSMGLGLAAGMPPVAVLKSTIRRRVGIHRDRARVPVADHLKT